MPMTVIVTRDVAYRIRGFLASCMLEIAPGVYTAPKMNRSVRIRIWTILEDWFAYTEGGAIVMTWKDKNKEGGQGVEVLGTPPVELKVFDDVILTYRDKHGDENIST